MPVELLSMGRTLVDLYPAQDGPLEQVTAFEKAVGGSPSNVAIAAARLGHRVGMISRVGDDAFGRFARSSLEAEGIDVQQVRHVSGASTPVAICEISPPDHFPLTIYRPDPPVDVAIVDTELDEQAVASATLFWTSLSGWSADPGRAAHRRAAQLRNGAGLVLDLDHRPAFWASESEATAVAREAAASASVLIGNLDECRIVTGAERADLAADRLLEAGAELVIVKLGADGVLAAMAGDRITVAPIAVDVANGLGAGDAFGGALCHGLLLGWPLAELIPFANAAGALVASRRGCSTAMPRESEVEQLLATSRRG